MAAPFGVLIGNTQRFRFHHILTNIFCFLFFELYIIIDLNECEVGSYWGFICISLKISGTEHISMCSLTIDFYVHKYTSTERIDHRLNQLQIQLNSDWKKNAVLSLMSIT